MENAEPMKLATLVIHAGHTATTPHGGVTPDLTLATTFERDTDGNLDPARPVYTRTRNPNRELLEAKLAALEGGQTAVAFASGQAATLSVFMAFAGKHILLPDDCYFASAVLLQNILTPHGITCTRVDMTNLAAVEQAIRPDTAVIWLETPSNPLLKITDIQAIVAIAKRHQLQTACDNTWATPYFTNPLAMGVDIVVHSTTKYLGGHSDILGGCVVLPDAATPVAQRIRAFQQVGGAVPSPFDCWLLNRSLATFPLRMPVHAANALALAEWLANHPKVAAVHYPGLPANAYHAVAAKQMQKGFGGMLSAQFHLSESDTKKLASSLRYVKHATSLGGVESLIEHRRSVEGDASKTPANLLRISCGIEDITDLIEDFEQALTQFP